MAKLGRGRGGMGRTAVRKRGRALPYALIFAIPLLVVAAIVVIFVIAPFSGGGEAYVDASPSGGADGIVDVPADTPNALPTPTPLVTPTRDPKAVRYLTDDEIAEMLARNNYSTDSERRLVEAAVSLVGKVNYFWGGKSTAVGIDPDWGELREVISKGDETFGTERPYGLDCSGYVNWCFIQINDAIGRTPDEIMLMIGDGTWNQWNNSQPVDRDDVRIGDLAFINSYPTNRGNHIGICVGFDENGEPLIAQCSFTMDNVVVSTCGRDFKYFRRPPVDITEI